MLEQPTCPRCHGSRFIRIADPTAHGDVDTYRCPECNDAPWYWSCSPPPEIVEQYRKVGGYEDWAAMESPDADNYSDQSHLDLYVAACIGQGLMVGVSLSMTCYAVDWSTWRERAAVTFLLAMASLGMWYWGTERNHA